MSEPILVRLFPEWGNDFPVWGVRRAEVELPDHLVDRLLEWQRVWERHESASDRPQTDAEQEALEWVAAQVRPLRLAVQAALGDHYRVVSGYYPGEFFSDIDLAAGLPPEPPPPPSGPYRRKELSIAEHNAQGSFNLPPPTVSVEQVRDFWLNVPIPDEVLIGVQAGLRQQQSAARARRRMEITKMLMGQWLRDHPEPANKPAQMEWRSDRTQAEFEADALARTASASAVQRCEDLRSLVRAISLMEAIIDLVNLGFGGDAVVGLLREPLPWGTGSATAGEILAWFPMANHWILAPGERSIRLAIEQDADRFTVTGAPSGSGGGVADHRGEQDRIQGDSGPVFGWYVSPPDLG